MSQNRPALDGVIVIDLTQFAAGPVCTLSLAQLGANVIKIERPVKGEQGRPRGGGQDYLWSVLHSNKKGITLNLKSPEGLEIFKKLVKIGDVVIENFAPGTMERLGITYEVISEWNPRCSYCQIKGYAENSPYADYPALDGPAQAAGCVAAQTGVVGGPPIVSGVTWADDLTGHYATTAIIAALFQREKTGRGQYIRMNMQEVMFSSSRMSVVHAKRIEEYKAAHPNEPVDNEAGRGIAFLFKGTQCPCDMFPTKPLDPNGDASNDYIYLSILNSAGNKAWSDFARVIGRPEWADNPDFEMGTDRVKHRAEIYKAITNWTMQHDKFEAWKILSDAHVTSGAVLTVTDLIHQDYMYENHMVYKVDHHALGEVIIPGCAYRLSDSYVEPVDSPDLGQHNAEVYKGMLDLTDKEIDDLKAKGII